MYAKLFTSIYQGTLRGNSHGLLVFTNLLAHADKDGVADIHPRAIAEEVGLTIDQVRAALVVLESPDDESRSPEEQGRRIVRLDEHRAWGWNVVNYVKYRSIRDEDDRREQNRRSQANWRAKRDADNKQSKPPSAAVSTCHVESANTEAEADTEEKTKTPRKRGAATPLVSVDNLVAEGVDQKAAADWLATRKAKGLPLTPTAWQQTKDQASKAGMSAAEAVQTAAGNAWGGFRASWVESVEAPRPNGAEKPKTVSSGAADATAEYLRKQAERDTSRAPAAVLALAKRMKA